MQLDRYESVEPFLSRAGPFLAAREAHHNLILGICSSLRRDPQAYEAPPYLATVSEGNQVVAAVLRTPPFNMVLSEMDNPAALRPVLDDLRGSPLPGVVGPPAAVRGFADGWVAEVGGAWEVVLKERIFQLTDVIAPRPADGTPRLAIHGDRSLIEEWLVAFGWEALNDVDSERIRLGLDDWERRGGRRFWLWEAAGRPVSMVGAWGETPNGIRIGPVYSSPSDRGNGFASNLTAWVSRAMLKEGRRFCFLYTDLANPTSNKIYQAIGYVPVSDALMVAFTP